MDVNTFDVSVNSAVLSGADNRKCAEFVNVVASIIIIIITPAWPKTNHSIFFPEWKRES